VPARAETIKLSINTLAPAASNKTLVASYFKKLVEERSHGRILPQVMEGVDTSAVQAVQDLERHKVQIVIPEINDLRSLIPHLKIYELPFLYRNREHLRQIIDHKVGQELIITEHDHHFKLLGIWEKGTNHLLASSPLPSPVDTRVIGYTDKVERTSTIYFQSPSSCSTAGLFLVEKKDGWCEVTLPEAPFLATKSGFYDLTLTRHSLSCCALLMDMLFWQQLPEDLKVIVTDAVKDATDYARDLALQSDQDALKKITAEKQISLHQLNFDQRQFWRDRMLKFYSKTINEVEKSLIDQFLNYQFIN
jgi:C4-dicarboxylate-binding protein DctP